LKRKLEPLPFTSFKNGLAAMNNIHKIDICLNAAKKLIDPAFVSETALNRANAFLQNKAVPWDPTTLGYGYPALIVLFSELNDLFPQNNWKKAQSQYTELLINSLRKQKMVQPSLFSGLTGICFTLHIASKSAPELREFHASFHKLLLKSLQVSDTPRLGLIDGVSGSLIYLLNYREHNETRETIHKIIHFILQNQNWVLPANYLINEKRLDQYQERKIEEYLQTYPHGCLDTGMAHGIAGWLAALSKAAICQVEVDGLTAMIRKMADWLKTVQQDVGEIKNVWPKRFAFIPEGQTNLETRANDYFDGWSYGAPGILNSLLLAATALRDTDLYHYALEQLTITANRLHSLTCPGFQYGLAGTLTILHQAAIATQLPSLKQASNKISELIIDQYNETHPFGFRCTPPGDENLLIDNPGLLTGSTGVILSLLFSSTNTHRPWIQLFGI
jgi:lantibiotic modifying enzyme